MWIDEIKAEFNRNPVQVIGVGALAVTAATKLLDVISAAQGRKAYAKQINHKIKNNNK